MRLLGWYQLEARQSTAAILYPAPVRVASIRVFPTGTQPFKESPDIVALTEPEAFFLDVFFNTISVQPSSVQDSQDKRAAPKNVLAPTRIAYAGDQTDFVVDMGLDFATRLVIFNGEFKSLFVAIYGDVVNSEPSEVATYEPKRLPVLNPSPLAPSLDPAHSSKPTLLAEQLLQLLPDRPEISVATRLVFALKPVAEDWDDPDFPNLFSDLDVGDNPDLDSLVNVAGRPIRDDISQEAITTFAMAMHDSLGINPLDDGYYVAKLLSMAASQQTRFSRALLQHVDLPEVFNEDNLDEATVFCLQDAAANIEIARYFREDEPFINSLENMQTSPTTDKAVRKALKKLLDRIRGWQIFEDALSNPNGDFTASASFLKDITAGEHSIGCWLECMINHESLAARVAEVPDAHEAPTLPPLLFQEQPSLVSSTSFLVFVKALLAVSTVLAPFAWADSIGDHHCRERALALLVLWQGVDGYREIVNHCLLLRQITRRLGWNKSDDIPTKQGTLAERLLVGLAKDPQAMLKEVLITAVLELEPPFSYITADELMEIGKLARVARDGLPSAIEELTFASVRPFSLRRLRVLRVSLAIIAEELTYDDGEHHVAKSFWSERSQGVGPTLASILADIADDLNHHFGIQFPPRMNHALSELLFHTANDILVLLACFAAAYPLISHDLRTLTASMADLYACADAASLTFSPSSGAFLASQNTSRNCIEILRTFSEAAQIEAGTPNALVVLRTLLSPTTAKDVRDPVHHKLQLYDLIMNILPQEPSSQDGLSLPTEVFPKLLAEFRDFSQLLEPETRTTFLERLVTLDNGEIGIGEWLLVEQMKELLTTLHRLSDSLQEDYKLVLQYHVNSVLHFYDLLISSPGTEKWAVVSLSANEDLSQLLGNCLALVLDYNISSLYLTKLTRQLAKHAIQFAPDIRFHILLLAARSAQADPTAFDVLDFVLDILKSLPAASIVPERLQIEAGRLFSVCSDQSSAIQPEAAETTLQILEWLASQEDVKLATLAGLSTDRFDYLCKNLASALPVARQSTLDTVKNKLIIDEDEVFSSATTELPDTLIVPLQLIESLLVSSPPTEPPSTPKAGTKTPDILGVVISPPSAVLRSPAATGLTKTYLNNDFRQLRQVPSTRMNTSRLPSTHVDEFEHLSQSPELLSAARIDVTGTGSMFQGFMPGMVG